ncbi:MAG TPA: helix-turn-helix domain-containing protein [Pyrinomonadaceae bacterium]|nr:helix-turn-helix domain-containing protein [Pyrinomonadaceae bacterium]
MLEQKHYAFEKAEAAPEQSASIKIKTLKELTLALLQEVESLKGNSAYDGKPSIDFDEEVRRFETDLIRWALMQTGGHQRRAARILNLKVTTLNAKIKRYGIHPHALHTGNVVDLYPEVKQ